jgi:hypothetical protein
MSIEKCTQILSYIHLLSQSGQLQCKLLLYLTAYMSYFRQFTYWMVQGYVYLEKNVSDYCFIYVFFCYVSSVLGIVF